ncbi:MAG: hypothetical protein AB8B50_02105 [Pirellulaceae bacterium]
MQLPEKFFPRSRKARDKRRREEPFHDRSNSRWQALRRKIARVKGRFFDLDVPEWISPVASRRPFRELGWKDYCNPINWARWMSGFVSAWFWSRRFTRLVGAAPAIAFGSLLLVWISMTVVFSSGGQQVQLKRILAESFEEENYRRAEIALSALLNHSPNSPLLQYQLAIANHKQERFKVATAQMEKLVADHEFALAAWWLVSQDYDLGGVEEWAEREHLRFRHLMQVVLKGANGENRITAQAVMAGYLANMGAAHDALRLYAEIVKARPQYALPALSLAKSRGQFEQASRFRRMALEHFNQRLTEDSQDVAARIGLAQTELLVGNPKKAAEVLNAGLRLTKSPELLSLLGHSLLAWYTSIEVSPETTLQRLQILKTAVSVRSQDPRVAQTLVAVLIECRDHPNPAVRRLREAVLQKTQATTAEFIRGTVALLENRFEEAKVHLRRAVNKQSGMPAILNNLAVAVTKIPEANLEHALWLSNEALKHEPKHPYFLETRGQILIGLSQWSAAIPDLERSLVAPELKSSVVPSLALAYEKTGNRQLAREFTLLAKSLSP